MQELVTRPKDHFSSFSLSLSYFVMRSHYIDLADQRLPVKSGLELVDICLPLPVGSLFYTEGRLSQNGLSNPTVNSYHKNECVCVCVRVCPGGWGVLRRWFSG